MNKPTLSPEVRSVLEKKGVIPAPKLPEPKVPTVEKLMASIEQRGGIAELVGPDEDGGYAASVTLDGEAFQDTQDHPAAALATAYAMALKAQPQQSRFAAD